jgi:chaperonin GroES
MNVQPINDWILVALDPIEDHVGIIYLPAGVDHRKATVLATGPGKLLPNGVLQPTDVVVGERVVFNRAHGEHLQGKKLLHLLGGDKLLIKPEDVLFVMNEEVTVS